MTQNQKYSIPDKKLRVQYIRTDGYHEDCTYPKTIVIKSLQELYDYYEANKYTYDLKYNSEYEDMDDDFYSSIQKYNNEYFENNALLLVLVQEGSAAYSHKVTNLKKEDEVLDVYIDTFMPEVFIDNMAEWHIVIELPQSTLSVQDYNVVINRTSFDK